MFNALFIFPGCAGGSRAERGYWSAWPAGRGRCSHLPHPEILHILCNVYLCSCFRLSSVCLRLSHSQGLRGLSGIPGLNGKVGKRV